MTWHEEFGEKRVEAYGSINRLQNMVLVVSIHVVSMHGVGLSLLK
jgi:hypothetical protein